MPIIQTQISAGVQPSGTKTITTNGVVDVSDYANADVQVPTTASDKYIAFTVNANNEIQKNYNDYHFSFSGATKIAGNALNNMFVYNTAVHDVDMSSITSIGNQSLYQAYYNSSITSLDLSSLTSAPDYSMYQMCKGCYSLTSVDLSALTTIGSYTCQYMFQNCNALTSVNIDSINTVAMLGCQNMFSNCTSLTNLGNFKLPIVYGGHSCESMFSGCTGLTNVDSVFNNITEIKCADDSGSSFRMMFYNCTGLTSLDLSSIKNIIGTNTCSYMFQGCTSLTSVDLSSWGGSVKDTNGSMSEMVDGMFSGCTSLENIDLSTLQAGYFKYLGTSSDSWYWGSITKDFLVNTAIKTNPYVNLSNAFSFSDTFYGCSELLDGTFPKLCMIGGNSSQSGDIYRNLYRTFYNCSAMTKCDFPALGRIYSYNNLGTFYSTFYGCTSLTDIRFPMLCSLNSNPFKSSAFVNNITVHFRKDMQSTIEGYSDYSTLWGAGSIVFDLIGTITVNGDTYYRQGFCNENNYVAWIKSTSNIIINGNTYTYSKNTYGNMGCSLNGVPLGFRFSYYDSTNNLYAYWWTPDVKTGDILFYTTGLLDVPTLEVTQSNVEIIYTLDGVEPQVGDTVYSDTQGTALGTIDSIA